MLGWFTNVQVYEQMIALGALIATGTLYNGREPLRTILDVIGTLGFLVILAGLTLGYWTVGI